MLMQGDDFQDDLSMRLQAQVETAWSCALHVDSAQDNVLYIFAKICPRQPIRSMWTAMYINKQDHHLQHCKRVP